MIRRFVFCFPLHSLSQVVRFEISAFLIYKKDLKSNLQLLIRMLANKSKFSMDTCLRYSLVLVWGATLIPMLVMPFKLCSLMA